MKYFDKNYLSRQILKFVKYNLIIPACILHKKYTQKLMVNNFLEWRDVQYLKMILKITVRKLNIHIRNHIFVRAIIEK